ncbi:MAG TPA: ABC transporter permease [Gemmatimonadaceae bacterium]|nr:ABC transporter permease [Gemmatimonadaceae bacterium]
MRSRRRARRSLDRGDGRAVRAFFDDVSPGFFDALRIPILLGRAIEVRDDDRSEPVVVVTKRLADALWPRENPIGRYLVRPRSTGAPRPPMRVVGVGGDLRFAGMRAGPGPTMFIPVFQNFDLGRLTLVVRGRNGLPMRDSALVRVLEPIAPAASVRGIEPLRATWSGSCSATG